MKSLTGLCEELVDKLELMHTRLNKEVSNPSVPASQKRLLQGEFTEFKVRVDEVLKDAEWATGILVLEVRRRAKILLDEVNLLWSKVDKR